MNEADVTINGVRLTVAQSMALRVAATSFLQEMETPGALGDDMHGRTMVKNYRARLTEVLNLMAVDQ